MLKDFQSCLPLYITKNVNKTSQARQNKSTSVFAKSRHGHKVQFNGQKTISPHDVNQIYLFIFKKGINFFSHNTNFHRNKDVDDSTDQCMPQLTSNNAKKMALSTRPEYYFLTYNFQ